jgi:outer membrane lipoprotein-sorting protein
MPPLAVVTVPKLIHQGFEPFKFRYTQMIWRQSYLFMRRTSALWNAILALAVLPATGCLLRTRRVEEQYSKAPLKNSTQQGLIDSVNQQAEAIRTLKATVQIASSAGGIKKGKVTDYTDIRGYILARKPDELRMVGLMPYVRTTAFDMVSDGREFKLSIPPKNKFVVGENRVVTNPNPDQPMQNIRPQNIYEALLIKHIDPDEIAVLENGYETLHDQKGNRVLQDDYELTVIRKHGDNWILERKIIFGRTDLQPHRQFIYSEDGKVATDAHYAEYKDYDGVSFPSRIEIYRPEEEYDITLNILKLEINPQLRDDQFVLQQPAGAQVEHLDRPQSSLVVPLGNQ